MVQYSGTRNNDYNAMEDLLRAALADRFALQAREKAEALAHARPWEHGALHTELLAARLPNVSATRTTERFCRGRGGCTWAEAMVVLSAAHDYAYRDGLLHRFSALEFHRAFQVRPMNRYDRKWFKERRVRILFATTSSEDLAAALTAALGQEGVRPRAEGRPLLCNGAPI